MNRNTTEAPAEKPLLSICIPTYNRASFLRVCLVSLETAAEKHWHEIEVLISDNDSTDDTREVVAEFQQRFPILYFKNETNIGGEPNFFAAGTRATADHVWIFGDDDVFGPDAITAILSYIHRSYDLIVVNFSDWSRQMDVQLKPSYLPWPESRTFDDSNEVLGTFRMHLGYISSIVVRKSILLAVPESDYARFIPYGFPHPYSIYCGLLAGCRVAYDARPLFQRRADNCVHFQGAEWLTNWLRVFLLGTAQIFEALGEKGYSAAAVRKAKDQTVSEHRGGILIPEIGSIDRRKLFAQMWPHYRFCPHFWLFWAPALVFPKGLLRGAHKMVRGKNAQLACGSKP